MAQLNVRTTDALADLAVLIVSTSALAQQVLKPDPPSSSLCPGTSVLVDDGSCPREKIKSSRELALRVRQQVS